MPGPLPCFPVYQKDLLSSSEYRVLSCAAKGLLFDLWMFQWEDGSLPKDEKTIRKICGCAAKEFKSAWPEVRHKFIEKDGRLRDEWLDKLREEKLAQVQKNVENGHLGGRPPKPKQNPPVSETETQTEPKGKPKRNHTQKPRDSETQISPNANALGRDDAPLGDSLIPELIENPPEPDIGKPMTPWQEVEGVLKGVAARLDTPDPTTDEVKRWIAASSPLRKLIGKYGIPGAVELSVYAMTHSPGCGWSRIWEANASYASQMKNGLASSYKNGQTETLAEASRRLELAGH